MFAAAVMMLATAMAVGVAKKLNLGSIVARLVVGMGNSITIAPYRLALSVRQTERK